MASSKPAKVCAKCGTNIFADSPAGLCSICLFRTALGSDAEEDVVLESSPPLTEFGDYQLLEEIGRGGQGVVYRARQKSLNRTVALKVIGLGQWSSTPHLRRFRHEAEAAARLEHPQIVPIYEIGEHDGFCYFSMKFVEGGQLDEIGKREPMSTRRAAELLVKLARTVQFAHDRGILHRDIKPGNILLDRQGEPHLTDFGLARLIEQESTITNSFDVLGTPSYMAPEQAAGHAKELTAAADVYALGAVFYQTLTGQPPFAGGTTYETIRMVLETEPRNPRLWNSNVDLDLATICLKCLEKDPKKRYETAEALAQDVERWLHHEPIHARRAGVITRSRKWARRNPVLAAVTPLVATLVSIIAVLFWKSELIRPLSANGIAVLPFENLSEEKANGYFADGIQDEILTRLAKIRALRVISRTSTQQYSAKPQNLSQIGRQLGVANILEGSVQKVANQAHISVQLIRAATDEHLWAESYNRKVDDVFDVEGEVAGAIAEELNAKLTGAEQKALSDKPTESAAAYDTYLRGISIENSFEANFPALQKAAAAHTEAVRLDPTFALAWARLAVVRSYLYGNEVDLENNSAGAVKEAADRAIALQPQLGEAWVAQGAYRYRVLRDFAGALQAYDEARKHLPNSALVLEQIAYVERRLGRWDGATVHLEEAIKLDPRNLPLYFSLAEGLDALRRFSEGQGVLDRALQVAPGDELVLAAKATLFRNEGRLDEAAKHLALIPANSVNDYVVFSRTMQLAYDRRFDAAVAQMQNFLESQTKPGQPLSSSNKANLVILGYCLEWAGRGEEARAVFTRVVEAIKPSPDTIVPVNALMMPCQLALAYAGLGEKDKALEQARRTVADYQDDASNRLWAEQTLAQIQAHFGEVDAVIAALPHLVEGPSGPTRANLRFDPMWDPLRRDPRFEKIVADLAPRE